jgi:hypothetical protein
VSENTKLNSSYVPRGTEQDLIAKLVGLEAPGSDDEVVAQDRENILYLNGSGFAGKSELLLWARDRCGQKDKDEDEAEADHEGSISLVRAHGQVVFASQSASGADHIDAWAGTITTMRQELQAEATRLGLEAPKFPIFDAFHARCVDEHRDRSFRKTVGIITGALGFLAIAAGVFDFVSIPDAARYLADFIDSRLARPIEVLFYIISVILVLNGSMKLDLAPWLIKLRDRWWKSGKYVELGANRTPCPARTGRRSLAARQVARQVQREHPDLRLQSRPVEMAGGAVVGRTVAAGAGHAGIAAVGHLRQRGAALAHQGSGGRLSRQMHRGSCERAGWCAACFGRAGQRAARTRAYRHRIEIRRLWRGS